MIIEANVRRVRETIDAACSRADRDPQSVTIVAISKQKSADAVVEAIDAGLRHFGENRVEEAKDKIAAVSAMSDASLSWHMVGHIQSRKAKAIPGLFHWTHAVDSVKLARKLSDNAQAHGQSLDVLIQINVAGETQKGGLLSAGWRRDARVRDQLWRDFEACLNLPGLMIHGLMTMAPLVVSAEDARPVFAELAQLRYELAQSFDCKLPELSMGMTNDYPVAIEEGATMVRIGRAIFGDRI